MGQGVRGQTVPKAMPLEGQERGTLVGVRTVALGELHQARPGCSAGGIDAQLEGANGAQFRNGGRRDVPCLLPLRRRCFLASGGADQQGAL